MKKLTVQDINNYVGTTVNPLNSPDTIYELYSVPSFDSDYPEVLHGSEIGSSKVTIEENDVLVCKINPRINRVWIVKHHTKHQLIASSEWVIIRSPENNPRYLMYYFQSPTFRTYINSGLTGIGGSLTRAQPKQIAKYPVPLPSIELQDRIAATLDKLKSIITHHEQQLKKLDELVKARFVEMFGNFVFEKDRWQKCSVGDIAGTVDPQPSHRTPPIDVDGIPYIGIAECNYQSRMIDFDSARKVGKNVLEEHIARYDLHNGDFIIGKIGTIGKPFFIPSERFYTLSANTVLIQPNSEMIAPQFLFSIFQSEYMDRIIDAEKKSTSQPAFGIQKVRAIEIPLPPLDLQNQFAAFVEQTDKSKFIAEIIITTIRRVRLYDQF